MRFDPETMKVKLCKACKGLGRVDGEECPVCGGAGRIIEQKNVVEIQMSDID